jgi:DNA-directed RNA polymerase specialized sigma24 family protein
VLFPRAGAECPREPHLAATWPETARRVRAYLVRRGVREAACEDILQEVAVRVLRSGVVFRGADDLVPWACVVVWRVHIGDYRKRQRGHEDALWVDLPSRESVEDAAVARMRFTEVARAIATLNDRDQSVLFATLADPVPWPDCSQASRAAVVRYRARVRLRECLEASASGPVGPKP